MKCKKFIFEFFQLKFQKFEKKKLRNEVEGKESSELLLVVLAELTFNNFFCKIFFH